MQLVHAPEELSAACDAARGRGLRVGLVLTMGALHRGHAALVAEAARRTDFVVATVFVNPTQFGPNEDFDRYPRTLEADVELARAAGAQLVFAPDRAGMYPAGDETRVRVGATAEALCGAFRPGHFEGVATVVTKFFGLAGRCTAFFGRKDYQQLRVITRFAADLHLPVEVVGLPTVREDDGVALSSRNRYLAPADRERARRIPEALSRAAHAFSRGERRAAELERLAREHVAAGVDVVEYVTVADADSVVPLAGEVGPRAVLALAVRVAGTRLIDNVVLGEDAAPLGEVP